MALFRLLLLLNPGCFPVLLMVLVLSLTSSSESILVIRFDKCPQLRSRFSTAVFQYSVVGEDGSNACTENGCFMSCVLDGKILGSCPADTLTLQNLSVNHQHNFRLSITTKDGMRNSSSYSWFIDTIPPTATLYSKQGYTNAERLSIDITFSEACTGMGGFKCTNSSNCDVLISGPAHVDASSLATIKPHTKYKLDIVLSMKSIYGRVLIKMASSFCTDLAGNYFTRTNASIFIVHLDRRPVQVDLWTSIPSYELSINGVPRTVTATNKMEDLGFFLYFSSPILNSTEQLLKALVVNSGYVVPILRSQGNRRYAFELKNMSRIEIVTLELQAASIISKTGSPISPVVPITFLYGPAVWLSTNSQTATQDRNINVIIEFQKPVFGFEASKVEVEGGFLTSFEEFSRALYSVTVLAASQNVSVVVPAGKAYDVAGNLNLASNQIQVIYSPTASIALHSFVSVGILATSVTAAVLSFSSATLEAIGALANGGTSVIFSDPSMNLNGMVGHLQVFALSDWLSISLPVEYSETTKGLRWLIPRQKLPWKTQNSSTWHNPLYLTGTRPEMRITGMPIKLFSHKLVGNSIGSTHFSAYLLREQPFPPLIQPKDGLLHEEQNATMKRTSYGLPLDSSEYFSNFLRGEPLSASGAMKRLENYTGWQDMEMNLFWIGVGGGSLLIIRSLALIFLSWRAQTSDHGTLSVPRFELFLLIVMLPGISQSAVFVIRGGTTWGIFAGTLLLAVPAGLILSAGLFLTITVFSGRFALYKQVEQMSRIRNPWYKEPWHILTGRPTIGRWFCRDGLPLLFLPRFGILFENRKGPPSSFLVYQNDLDGIYKDGIDSFRRGIGGTKTIGTDDSNEDTKVPVSKMLCGCARSFYLILDLTRRVCLGVLSGFHPSIALSRSLFALSVTLVQFLCLFTLQPYIARGLHVVECVSLLCEAGIFGISLISSIKGWNLTEERSLGYVMLVFLFLTFVSQIINQWYAMVGGLARFSHPQNISLKLGLKHAGKGLVLPFLPTNYWSRFVPTPETVGVALPPLCREAESKRRRHVKAEQVDPLNAMTATVVPVQSPSPGRDSCNPAPGSRTGITGTRAGEGKQQLMKGVKCEPKAEMRRLRELARASFSRDSKYEEGSTSYVIME